MVTMDSCAACGVNLKEHISRGENVCNKCNKVFCTSCYGLKLKLEKSAGRSKRGCSSCQQLIALKKKSRDINDEATTALKPPESPVTDKEQNASAINTVPNANSYHPIQDIGKPDTGYDDTLNEENDRARDTCFETNHTPIDEDIATPLSDLHWTQQLNYQSPKPNRRVDGSTVTKYASQLLDNEHQDHLDNVNAPGDINGVKQVKERPKLPPVPPQLYSPNDNYRTPNDQSYDFDDQFFYRDNKTEVYDSDEEVLGRSVPFTTQSLKEKNTKSTELIKAIENDPTGAVAANADVMSFGYQDYHDVADYEDIIAYNDIPRAMLYAGIHDNEYIAKALKKQLQINMMTIIQKKNNHTYDAQLNQVPALESSKDEMQKEIEALRLKVKELEMGKHTSNTPDAIMTDSRPSTSAEAQMVPAATPSANIDTPNPQIPRSDTLEPTKDLDVNDQSSKSETPQKSDSTKKAETIKSEVDTSIQSTQTTIEKRQTQLSTNETNYIEVDDVSQVTPRLEDDKFKEVRLKRLARFGQGITESDTQSIHSTKADNREFSPNIRGNKVVKSKVFKNAPKVVDNTTDNVPSYQRGEISSGEQDSRSLSSQKDQPQQSIAKPFQQEHPKFKAAQLQRSASPVTGEETSTTEDTDSDSDGEEAPPAMKFLRRNNTDNVKNFLHSINFSNIPVGTNKSDNPTKRDRKSRSETEGFKKRTENSGDDKTESYFQNTGSGIGGAKKNKNLTPTSSSTDKKQAVQKKKEQPSVAKPPIITTGAGEVREESVDPEKLHMTFQRLKHANNTTIKCSACGRPECKGENVQSMKDLIAAAKNNMLEVRDVSPDGNCMFTAIIDQLQMYEQPKYMAKGLREAAVAWLMDNPYCEDGETHYMQFLSEDWGTYIQRMMSEGEWGDHITLRAIANIVGYTIRILNTINEQDRWTIVEPLDGNKKSSDIHLFLGHVGEFHYTSLRPCDGKTVADDEEDDQASKQTVITEEKTEETAIEGFEEIAMFKEDYIDAYSDFPVAHLSFLLKTLVPNTVLNTAAINSSCLQDYITPAPPSISNIDECTFAMEDGGPPLTVLATGSVAEGSLYPKLFQDEDINRHWFALNLHHNCQKDYVAVPQSEFTGFTNCYCLKDVAGKPGRVTLLGPKERASIPLNNKGQITTLAFRYGYTVVSLPVEIKMAFKCSSWPHVSKPWLKRPRYEGWPSRQIIEAMPEKGCIVELCFADGVSTNEWQYTFVYAEQTLFQEAVSQDQKHCYLMLCFLLFHALKCQRTLPVRILKHVFFYTCERIPSEYFKSSPGSCVLYMIDQLQQSLSRGFIPNYFIPSSNLISDLPNNRLKSARVQLRTFRANPQPTLQKIHSSTGFCIRGYAILKKVIENIAEFKVVKSVKESVISVFIPCLIDIARDKVYSNCYDQALESLNETFQERLSVSTCDDAVLYHQFLQGALSGIGTTYIAWFATFIDKQLKGQLSKTMIREMCGDLTLITIDKILPAETVGSYGSSEIPEFFTKDFFMFCHDYAAFLVFVCKPSDAVSVLYYCIEKYRSVGGVRQDATDVLTMFYLYVGLLSVYRSQNQLDLFKPFIDEMIEIAQQTNDNAATCVFVTFNICNEVGDTQNAMRASYILESLPRSQTTNSTIYTACRDWPTGYLIS